MCLLYYFHPLKSLLLLFVYSTAQETQYWCRAQTLANEGHLQLMCYRKWIMQ